MGDNKKMKVLIAEDDFLVCKAIKRSLEKIGYEIIGTASNGMEAVEVVQSLKPDVILMDINMPKMNGLEAAEEIDKKCPTPIIIITAHESQDLVEQASKMGVGAYLTKPPRTEDIERAVTIAVNRHKDLMEMKRLYVEIAKQKEDLEKALKEIKTLRGILPICSSCKKIRDDDGYWSQVEVYLHKHTDTEFTHGLCPDCVKELYPNLKISKKVDEINKQK